MTLTSALVLASLCACSDGGSPSGAQVENLQLAFDRVHHGGELIAFTVDEVSQGGDYNGDGDSADDVLHVHDLTTGTTVNLSLAVRGFRVDGRRVVFQVSELRHGPTDFNNDGDTVDDVLHVFDADSGVVTNLGLAILDGFEVDEDVLVFQIPEAGQEVDLNGDGDLLDDVVHVHDLATGVTTNLNLAAEGLARLDQGSIAFAVNEAEQFGADLNGDGDALDHVLHVVSPSAGTTNLQLAVSILFLAGSFADFDFRHGLIAVAVREPDQGNSDLDGDGDLTDNVLHVHDTLTGVTTNLGLPIRNAAYGIGDGFVATQVTEAEHAATDLNLDGDISDSVLQVHVAATGVTTNTRLAVFRFSIEGELVLAQVLERDQGGTDLTGDGDALDLALILYDASTGIIDNPRAPGERTRRLGSDLLAFEVQENLHGGDLNGDGDILDRILFLYDLPSFVTTNLEVAGRILDADDRHLVYVEFEESEDLNGDGDVLDPVLHFLDVLTGVTTNVGLAGSATDSAGIPLGFEAGVLPFATSEFFQGDTDLNGDGDAFDSTVLYLVDPPG